MRRLSSFRVVVTENYADVFLLLAVATLLVNFVSQPLAMPIQAALIIVAIIKCDIKLIPAICVLLFDKRNFLSFDADLMKYRVGISLGVSNVFIIGLFFLVIFAIISNRVDRKSLRFVVPWFVSAIPAVVIGLMAKSDCLASSWQQPFVDFLTPSIYFWGCLVGRNWWSGRDYFIKRMLLIYGITGGMALLQMFGMRTAFAVNVVPICLALAAFKLNHSLIWKSTGVLAGAFGLANMVFGRILSFQAKGLYTNSIDLGSTFTSVFVIVIGVGLALSLGLIVTRRMIKIVPWFAVLVLSLIFVYAVARASTGNQSEVVTVHGAQSLAERFEAKLIGDRGAVWKNAIDNEVFIRPLVFKRLRNLYIMRRDFLTGEMVYGMLMPPHNQVLTLLWRNGLWFGGTMIVFLFWICGRAFGAASILFSDRATLIALLCPFAGVFFAVGLTGQSVFTATFFENAIASLFFPGVIYGAVLSVQYNEGKQYMQKCGGF